MDISLEVAFPLFFLKEPLSIYRYINYRGFTGTDICKKIIKYNINSNVDKW